MTFENRLIELSEKDLELRTKLMKEGKLSENYNSEMEALHNKNADELQQLIEEFGFPFEQIVGKKAANAAWLIIQHSISKPEFMRYCKAKMEENKVDFNKIHLAYLTDRIAFFEGKQQLFGTQFDWNENDKLVPIEFDTIDLVNQRRKSIGLNSLEEQTKIIRDRAISENQKPPQDYKKRKKEFDLWREKVGWI